VRDLIRAELTAIAHLDAAQTVPLVNASLGERAGAMVTHAPG